MAVTAATAEFLAEARAAGADFGRTLTIGRQASFVGPFRLGAIMKRNGVWPAGETRRRFYRRFREGPPWLIDPYLHALGTTDLSVLDVSDFEGADILHDLGQPVPAELDQRFDPVQVFCGKQIAEVPIRGDPRPFRQFHHPIHDLLHRLLRDFPTTIRTVGPPHPCI